MLPGRAIAFLLVLAASIALAACGGGEDKGGAPGGDSSPGVLIYTRPDGIMEYDVASGDITPLVQSPEANSFVLDPAVSRDGTRLAYINQPPPKVEGTRYDAGSDLWIANRDGSDARLLFAHVTANQLVRYPKWGADGALYAIVQEIETTGGLTSVVYTLQRFETESGARETVLRDVLAYALSPDGERVAYARFARDTGEAFEAVPLAGGEAETLVAATEKLAPFNSPQYSPDGAFIAFASADQTTAPVIPRGGRRSFARPAAPGLDGLPQDIWTIPASGGRPTRVADLKEDLPALTWNGDSTKIYVLGVAGLYEVDLENGATTRIGTGAFHGQIVWAAK
jgi:Tol biopolymer transport system component